MQDGTNAKQLIVERVKQSTNILVAVSASPSVDALSAALSLGLMLNKMQKHATTLFSGAMPPAMDFLEPGKAFENNVDSLRDFIISLDKDKADRLRYKVEDDVVKIFITPYRTSINQDDLQFSQGDFNVELIIALGVEKRDDLDKAIVAHGRILHDATVVTINNTNQKSSLGAVDWNDPAASSLCEMLVALSESFQQPGMLDAQIATALLTGIVAATERFSNEHTTPRVMTMSAQLMAAGANQQLIATNLRKANQIPEVPAPAAQIMSAPIADTTAPAAPAAPEKKKADGELDIAHDKFEKKRADRKPERSEKEKRDDEAVKKAEEALAAALPPMAAPANVAAMQQELAREQEQMATPAPQPQNQQPALPAPAEISPVPPPVPVPTPQPQPAPESVGPPINKKKGGRSMVSRAEAEQPADGMEESQDEGESYLNSTPSWRGTKLQPPSLGGTLNATTEQAFDAARQAEREERNKTILSHDNDQPAPVAPVVLPPTTLAPAPQPPQPAPPAAPAPEPTPEPAPVVQPQASLPPLPALPSLPEPAPAPAPDPAELQRQAEQSAQEAAAVAQPATNVASDLDAARQAVTDALAAQPFDPARQPAAAVATQPLPQDMPPPPPPMPGLPPSGADVNALPPLPPMPPLPTQEGGVMTPVPPPPPLQVIEPPAAAQPPVAVPVVNNPAQYKIPGQ